MRVLILTLSRAKPIITVHMLCKISVARCRKTLLANNLHYMTKKQLINMLLTTHCLDKQEWLQYSPLLCNIALLPVKEFNRSIPLNGNIASWSPSERWASITMQYIHHLWGCVLTLTLNRSIPLNGITSCITSWSPSERRWASITMQYIHHLRVCAKTYSFAGKANYYGTHVVQNKCCALQENFVSK